MQAPERGAVVRVFPIAAATRGSKGDALNDYAALKSAGAVAVSDDGLPILKDSVMRETLPPPPRGIERDPARRRHADDPWCGWTGSMKRRRHGFQARPARHAGRGRVLHSGARHPPGDRTARHPRPPACGSHLHCRSSGRSAPGPPQRLACYLRGGSAPFPAHEEHVGLYNTNAKMCPPLRSAADRDAMIEAILDGVVDAIANRPCAARHSRKGSRI